MGVQVYNQQVTALLWRNYLIKSRNWKQTWTEILFPVYFVVLLAVFKITNAPEGEPPVTNFQANSLEKFLRPGLFYVHDNSPVVRSIMSLVQQNGNFTKTVYFSSIESMEESYQILVGESREYLVIAGILFDVDTASLRFNYTIRMKNDVIPGKTLVDLEANRKECRDPSGFFNGRCKANNYLWSGFASLQASIDSAIIQLYGNNSMFERPDISARLLPKFALPANTLQFRTMSSMYMVIAFFPFVGSLLALLVMEKEKKIKETMRIMGLMDSAFWSSWGLIYLVESLILCVTTTLIAWSARFFSRSNVMIFFLLVFLYCMSVITFSFALSTFFNNAKLAGTIGTLAPLAASTLNLAVIHTRTVVNGTLTSAIPAAGQWALCLLSPCALSLGIDWALYLDVSVEDGANFNENMYYGQFPLYAPLVMLSVDVALYAVLAVWFDKVVPNEYGQSQPLWFFLLPSFWRQETRTAEEVEKILYSMSMRPSLDNTALESNGCEIEEVPPSMINSNVMRISNIRKVFKVKENNNSTVKHAIKGISLDIYEGQITALLGHNGAGKTTLINMLTGLMQPTSGTATIFGLDTSNPTDMGHIRSFTGVCPQENTLFDELTPREHLRIYAMLAGSPKDTIQKQMELSLEEVDLKDKGNTHARNLSGGQKRKLSLAIALIGDPKVLFLDEPTAGMDPYSRRHVWSVLKNRRSGRVIVLTTHFMDEADILADRKAVISQGRLKCVGSSLFLKNKFGVGYHLNMVLNPQVCNVESVRNFIHQCVPKAGESRLHGMELTFTLPHTDVGQFAGLFSKLEEKHGDQTTSEVMGITSYGVAMTTLEEVFLKLEGEHEDKKELEDHSRFNSGTRDAQPAFLYPNSTLEPSKLPPTVNPDLLTLEPSKLPPTVNPDLLTLEPSKLPPTVKHGVQLKKQQFLALLKIRLLIQIRNAKTLITRLGAPVAMVVVAMVVYKYVLVVAVPLPPAPYHINLDPHMYAQSFNSSAPPMLLRSQVGFESTPPYFMENYPSFKNGLYSQGFTNFQDFDVYGNLLSLAPHHIGYDIIKYTVDTSVVPNQLLDSNFTVLYNDTAVHSIPGAINALFNSILRSSITLPPHASTITALDTHCIKVSSYSWQATRARVSRQPFHYGAFVLVILVAMAMSFIPISSGSDLVQEREVKIRGQLKTAGVTHNMYLASILCVDILEVYAISILIIVLVLIFQPTGLDSATSVGLLVMMVFFFPFLNLFSTYIISYMFDRTETALNVLPNLVIMVAMLPYMINGLLGSNDSQENRDIALVIHTIFCIIDPLYIPYGALHYIQKVHSHYTSQHEDKAVPLGAYFEWDAGINIVLITSVVHTVWMFLLWRQLDLRATSGDQQGCCEDQLKRRRSQSVNFDIPDVEDEDVREERKRILAMDSDSSSEQPVVKVLNLRKVFKKPGSGRMCLPKPTCGGQVIVAVKNVSFAVMPGQVFGLLGPNGAGKTTTLSMIIAELTPNNGKVTVGGHDVHSSMSEAFRVMGYCPQHDALWEKITLQEHLQCYLILRGFQVEDATVVANHYMSGLAIGEHKHKWTKNLSGGTKRKLSYAMSMLGDPKLVLLDEPSTGMDPKSKRFLWNTITRSFEGSKRGAILTTHYMEEADALCSQISIMVNGRMECIGSSQHLKGKYGSGDILEIKVKGCDDQPNELQENVTLANEYITRLFPDVERVEIFSDWMTYKIPQDSVPSLAFTFQSLEDGKRDYKIEQYSFSQCTLEQVFLQFAKMQDEKNEDDGNAELKRRTSLVIKKESVSQETRL